MFATSPPIARRSVQSVRPDWWPEAADATRTITAFVAAAALLMQLCIAAPLRLLAYIGPIAWPGMLCAAAHTQAPGEIPSPAPSGHDNCPICQSHGVPLGILTVALPLLAASASWWRWVWPAVATPTTLAAFRNYLSRAPPAGS